MTWADRNRDLVEAARAYVAALRGRRPEILAFFENGASPVFPFPSASDRGRAILLFYSALYQGIGEGPLTAFLGRLYGEFGPSVFKLNRMPFATLRAWVDGQEAAAPWGLRPQVPGILRSVCDFFYRTGPLGAYLERVSGAALVEELAQGIFLMGKTSPQKYKARLFLWLMTQVDERPNYGFWDDRTALPLTQGHGRFMHFLGPLRGRKHVPWSDFTEKQRYYSRFYAFLLPGRTWDAHTPFDAYLKRSQRGGFVCRNWMGGCVACPLNPYCEGGRT